MRSPPAFPADRRRSWLLAVVGAALAAAAAPLALAQTTPDKPAQPAPAAKPSSLEGVTVNAARRPALGVPPAKAAAYAGEAAKSEAWRKYRASKPPLTADPNDQSKDYPGLKTYLPK